MSGFKGTRYANVTSTMALVVALGGTGAYAANTIRSSDIVNGQVKRADIANNAVTSGKVSNNSLRLTDFRASDRASLRGAVGPAGAPGANGANGANGTPGAKGDKGDPGTSVFASTIPSGQTVTGVLGLRDNGPSAGGAFVNYVVSLPVPAPADLLAANVNFAPDAAASDDDATCTGSAATPTAPAGKACIYVISASNAVTAQGFQVVGGASAANRRGFNVGWDTSAAGATELRASWAYTAP
jgi:hypothetical protein